MFVVPWELKEEYRFAGNGFSLIGWTTADYSSPWGIIFRGHYIGFLCLLIDRNSWSNSNICTVMNFQPYKETPTYPVHIAQALVE